VKPSQGMPAPIIHETLTHESWHGTDPPTLPATWARSVDGQMSQHRRLRRRGARGWGSSRRLRLVGKTEHCLELSDSLWSTVEFQRWIGFSRTARGRDEFRPPAGSRFDRHVCLGIVAAGQAPSASVEPERVRLLRKTPGPNPGRFDRRTVDAKPEARPVHHVIRTDGLIGQGRFRSMPHSPQQESVDHRFQVPSCR
jgi:hypothetical protein